MKTTLWIVQVVLALMFIGAGTMKLVTPYQDLVLEMEWAGRVSQGLITFIAVIEIIGGLGLILPAWLRILPVLTPIASVGLVVLMFLAAINHAQAGEYLEILINVVLGALAAFVAWGRLFRFPIRTYG